MTDEDVLARGSTPAEEGGEAACMLPLLCPSCGRVLDAPRGRTCPACDAPLTDDPVLPSPGTGA